MENEIFMQHSLCSREKLCTLLNITSSEFSKLNKIIGVEVKKLDGTFYLTPDEVEFFIQSIIMSKLNSEKKVKEIHDTFNEIVYSFFDEWKHELSPEFSNVANSDLDRIYESAFAEYSSQLCFWLSDKKQMSYNQQMSLRKLLSNSAV